jgi:hypothetical protein
VPEVRCLPGGRCHGAVCRLHADRCIGSRFHHHGQGIVAVVAEHAEPQHVPEPEYGMVLNELKLAAFPPPAASPFRPPRRFRGRPPQRMRGRSYGQYVVTNEDGDHTACHDGNEVTEPEPRPEQARGLDGLRSAPVRQRSSCPGTHDSDHREANQTRTSRHVRMASSRGDV